MRKRISGPIMCILGVLLLAGCAEPVGDIDRTQGNLVRKTDLDGQWYMLQTVIGVPPTSWYSFIGESSVLERVRWEIQKDWLIGYRAYPRVRGADSPTLETPFDGTDNPIAAYPIIGHVDVMREYDTSTGEQNNVISENTFDRLWFEREYVRVDWSRSAITNLDFIAPTMWDSELSYFVQEEQGGETQYRDEALYREEDESGLMSYFDFVQKWAVFPDEWGCAASWWGLATDDCTSSEIEVRTSFSRAPERPDYEPFHYNDQMLSRFGYFRTEYFNYDEQRGITDAGRRYLIQRHNIWKQTYRDGEVIPLPAREIRTVPYYLSSEFPDDPELLDAARITMEQWNTAIHRGLGSLGFNAETPVFVLCQNPVSEDDHAACGNRGFSPRIGDLRFSSLHWVEPETLDSLLGYGPAAADPLTGEIISGKAYVYGAVINRYATYAVDVIRYFNDQFPFESLISGHYFANEIAQTLAGVDTGTAGTNPALDRMPIERPLRSRPGGPERRSRPNVRPGELKPFDLQKAKRRLDAALEQGAGSTRSNREFERVLQAARGARGSGASERVDELEFDRILNPMAIKAYMARRAEARAHTVDMADMIAPDIEGLVKRYAGETDYVALWKTIRAEVFASTAEHEVGHTLGLRHNFQGSYDSLNYHEAYWNLREENLFPAQTVGDVYRLTDLTTKQSDGMMRQKQFSSIMDYGYAWQNDLEGLGKYDTAAIVFGYTAGSYAAQGDICLEYPSVATDEGCLAKQPGLIQVFKKKQNDLGEAGRILDEKEAGFSYDDPGLPSIAALERYHYTTIALAFPQLSDLLDEGRKWMPYSEFAAQRDDENRTIRVPYLFCSDEWAGGLVSCHAFDQGADPFEITRAKIRDYRAYYPFVNFRRDNPFFDYWFPLIDYFYYNFLPISDVFQSWYVAPWGQDPLFDRVFDMAIGAGFNLLSEVMATPAYGLWCPGPNGELLHLSDAPVLQGDDYVDPACDTSAENVYIPPGIGRRTFSIYDPQSGYYLPFKPQEAGHYWATLAAVWAMTDPDAYVLGVDGDAGTYAISYYDWFSKEFVDLMNAVLTKDYSRFGPRASISEERDELGRPVASLKFRSPAVIYDEASGSEFNPEDGRRANLDTGGPTSFCEPCGFDSECTGHTGAYGGIFCQPISEGDGEFFCLQDCSQDTERCPRGTTCSDEGNCVPDDEDCSRLVAGCDENHPIGKCDTGVCVDGICQPRDGGALVYSEPSFMLTSDIIWYGFMFTTASFSTRFNDQLNVFRPGTPGQVEVIEDSGPAEIISFTHPVTGVSYAAVQPHCPEVDEVSYGGHVGMCGTCSADTDCAGFSGYYGGIECLSLGDGDLGQSYCLQDCSDDPDYCGVGFSCNGTTCVPDGDRCFEPRECSQTEPYGACAPGRTCIDGQCVSSHCLFGDAQTTGAVLMIRRAQALGTAYEKALSDWYRLDSSEEEEDQLRSVYDKASYELNEFTDLLETLLATYQYFGRIY